MKSLLTSLLIFASSIIFAQTKWTTVPAYPTQTDQITITFDVSGSNPPGKTPLANYSGNVYAHTGVYVNNDESSWKYVISNWGNNTNQPQLTFVSSNIFRITISNPRTYYNVTNGEETITKLCFVLRSADGNQQTEDIKIPLYPPGISVVFNTPTVDLSYGDPLRSPVFVSAGGTVPISVSSTAIGRTQSIKLYVNGVLKSESGTETLSYTFRADDYSGGKNEISVVAMDIAGLTDSKTFVVMKNPAIKNLSLTEINQPGIYYNTDQTKVTLALYAPLKKNIYVIGDFNDWRVDTDYYMNRDISIPDSLWWITIPGLQAGTEYAYQFLIDGALRIYDPYTDKILDPWNDQYISSTVFPNLKQYPTGKTSGIVSVFQTGQSNYNWIIPNFVRPAKEKLVIYELLVRDFVSTHSYKTLIDTLGYLKKLGVNALELMPINEFEGNNSWGYNPMTFFAPDKYYGNKNDLKKFIDACHQNGIAVIQDIVLNHAYNSNSMAQMYWDNLNNRPAALNPWFNAKSNFANPDAQWGNDFNHESLATQYFVDRVLNYWITEFKIDGFRFDFTKGFSNTPYPASGDNWGSTYDPARIRLLKRMVDKVWSYDPESIMIFEHLAENREDQELAAYGILMWGNMNYNYSEAAMGYVSTSNFGGISYKSRGWSLPNLVGYMESHDEQRVMFKNLIYGNSSGNYNIRNLQTALERMKLASAFFIPVPGPKMIWMGGELGYDVSIDFNGRLGEKPFAWNYFSEPNRKSLFDRYAALIRLKKSYPAFSGSDFTLNASGSIKSLYINHSSMDVAAIGNFDVSTQTGSLTFNKTGKMYEFFSGDSASVTAGEMQFSLQPGEHRLYTSVKIPKASILAGVKKEEAVPSEFRLEQNYPNPFNPETIISYQLPSGTHVSMKIYDLLGREVATLVDEFKQAGTHISQFPPSRASSILNSQFSTGVYFYRIVAGDFVQSKKMLLLK